MLLIVIFQLFALFIISWTESASIEHKVCQFDNINDLDLDNFTEEDIEPVEKNNPRIFLKEDKKTCSESTTTYPSKKDEGLIKLKCDKGFIVNVSAVAVANGKVKCTEHTTELKVSGNDCWWKRDCLIHHLPARMYFPFDHFTECFRKMPDSVELSYSCLDQDIPVFDVIPSIEIVNASKGYIENWKDDIPSYFSLLSNGRFRIQFVAPANKNCGNFKFAILKGKFARGNHWFVKGDGFECSEFDNHESQVMYLNGTRFNVDLNLDNAQQIVPFRYYFEWCSNETISKQISHTVNIDPSIPRFNMIKDIKSEAKKGVIRSHKHYPWHYPRNVGLFEKTPALIRTSYFHLVRAPTYSLTTLKLTVFKLNIAAMDKLSLIVQHTNNTESAIFLKESQNYTCHDCKQLRVNFTVVNAAQGYHPSKSGFLILYEWSANNSMTKFFNPATKCEQQDETKCQGKKSKSCRQKVSKEPKEIKKKTKEQTRKKKRDEKSGINTKQRKSGK